MKYLFRSNVFIAACLLLAACGQAPQATPLVVQPTVITTETRTPFPTITPQSGATTTIVSTPRPTYVQPTIIPTIDPVLVPDLLKNAFSIKTLEDFNGYDARMITGWDYGFGTSIWYNYCPAYVWLDKDHILLYPGAGQTPGPGGLGGYINAVPQPAILNLKNGVVWLPPVNPSTATCNHIYWSQELEILVIPGSYDDEEAVLTYSVDGTKLAYYPGTLNDISPSKTKVLINNDTIIDLRTFKKTDLNWSLEDYYEPFLGRLFWASGETRIYRCCYFYADLVAGISQRFQRSDFHDKDGNHLNPSGLWFQQGQWVRDSTYFLVYWLAVDDGPVRYQPFFDPATKLFYDLWEEAGISPDFTWRYNDVSPDGNYVWIIGFERSYLVNLTNFESQLYSYQSPYTYADVNWSADSNFAWHQITDSENKSTDAEILSISDKKLHSVPTIPQYESMHLWHLTDNIVVYPAADKNALIFLDASTMSFRELSFTDQESQYKISNLAWNTSGDKLVFITDNHILWQVDYPALENMEQIIASANTIIGAQWSPDGNSIAFVSDSDIYIVDVRK